MARDRSLQHADQVQNLEAATGPVVLLTVYFSPESPQALAIYEAAFGVPMPGPTFQSPLKRLCPAPEPVTVSDLAKLLIAHCRSVGPPAAMHLGECHAAAAEFAIEHELLTGISHQVLIRVLLNTEHIIIGRCYTGVLLHEWAGKWSGEFQDFPDSEVIDEEQPTVAEADFGGRRMLICGASGRDAMMSMQLAIAVIVGEKTPKELTSLIKNRYASSPRSAAQVAEAIRGMRKVRRQSLTTCSLESALKRPELAAFSQRVTAELTGGPLSE